MRATALVGLLMATSCLAAPAMASVITVTSPSGVFTNAGPTNASGPGASYDSWYANNVRAGSSAGITNTYPDAGNGSLEFGAPTGAKADFEYYFSAPNRFSLSTLNVLSYDVYRNSSSTAAARYEPALRLYVSDGSHTGYLVFEGTYNGQPATPVDTIAANNVISNYFWATGSLPDAFNVYNRTLSDWTNRLPNLQVLGLSTGVGSGWDGTFSGAIDNIAYGVAGRDPTTFNFEVAGATAVPEPASIALLTVGLVGLAANRRRHRDA